MKKYIFLLIALLSSLSTWAVETYKTGTITYKVYDTAETPYATVYQDSSSVKKLTGTVSIPASITYNETDYPVTKIERWYYGNEVDLVLPSSIKQESDVSWSYFSNLNSLTLPENATFTQFSLSNVRKSFGELIIPKTITSIVVPTSSSYGGSWNVRAYKVDADNPNYKSTTDGVLLTKDETVLVTYPYKKEGVSYTIPANVTTIGDYAFYNNDNLETVILPSGVTTIGNRSFYDCGALYKCEIPVTVTSIGVYAFYACNKLSVCDITPLTALQTIGQYAFYNCKLNTSNNTFTLPANLKTIGSYAFYSAFDNNYNVTVEFPSTLGESGSQVKLDGSVFNNYTIRSYMNDPVNCNSNDAFYYVSRIYIPAGTTSTYKAKTGWGYSDGSKLLESASLDIDDNLVAPTITQILDAENELVSVKLSSTSTEAGAKILYRIFQNGAADVDVSDWYTYNGTDVFPMDNLSTIKARTTMGGKYSAESQYTVDISSLRCPAPDIITAANSKTMTMATTVEGGSIYYTTNNTTPSKTNGTKYTGQITLDGNFYYQAIVVKDGMFSSTITTYDVTWFKCKTPEVSYEATTPDGTNVNVVLTSDEPGVTLKYRSDGSSEFMPYTGPVTTSMNSYFYYMATKPNYQDSDAPSIYTYRDNIKCDKPEIAVDQTTKQLTLSAPEGVNIYYTLNGVNPTVSDENKYAGSPITLTGNCQIKAIAHKSGWFQSEQAYVNINNWFVCPNVVIEQVFENGLPKMKLSLDETTGVDLTDMKIYYLVGDYYTYEDGWRNNGLIYSGPVEVESGYTIYAVAIKDGYIMSDRSSKRMDYSAYTRCASPSVEIDNEKKTVSMSTDETNGKVYYTLDGTTPTTASTLYESPFTSEVNCTIKAITARDPETVDEVTTIYANSSVVERNLDDWFRVPDVIFQPVLGDAEGEYKMALLAEEGAKIYYGINQEPTVLYTDTFAVSAGDWLYAMAKKDGYVDSYQQVFRINDENYKVKEPNVYLNEVTHEMVVTPVTYGSTIYYTYDKSDPDPASSTTFKVEKDTIKIVRNGTYKFIAVKDRMTNSSVQSYNIEWFRVPEVTITPIVQDNVLKVKLECEDADAIYYGINEYESETITANANYTEPFEVPDGVRVYASAVKDGYSDAYWTNSGWIYKSNYTCATPTITVAADTTVTIASNGENETIYYTLNGDDPTTSSTKFTSKFKLQSNVVIKAIAVASDKLNSSVRTREYSGFKVSSVVITPIVVDNKMKVKLETSTPGAKIYYAINENNPTTTLNMNYTEPFDIANGDYIYANAVKEGYNEAGWSTHEWIYYNNYTCSQPTITVRTDTMVVMSADEDATIYYTLDGTDPTTSSTKYTSEFKLTRNATIKAMAVVDGRLNSNIRSREYSGFVVSSVVITPIVVDNKVKVELTSTTPDAQIYYNINTELSPVSSNIKYTGPFEINDGDYIHANALKDGYNEAGWSTHSWIYFGDYTSNRPTITVNSNNTVSISGDEGATFYYTIGGETPTTSSTKYTSEFAMSRNDTIKAIAVQEDKLISGVTWTYCSGFTVSSVVITPIVVDNKMKVKLETATPGAKIYYAINENNPTTTLNMNYTEPFDIANGDYIFANAVKEGYNEAGWSTHEWIYYNNYTCSQPTITVRADTMVVMSADEGATIYYTLDGTDPTTSSTKYTSEFKLTRNASIKAIAIGGGKMNSGIRERVYNGFNVKNIDFALNGIKMTLTSETPGVTFNYCYENDPREEVTGNLVYSRTYTGPFDMEYNGYIYVRASRDGYNSAESNYWVSGLVKWAKPEASSFDGHKLVFKDIPGAQIWYTTNGDYPEANYRSTLYKDSILISNTGVIRAIAVGDYKNQSDIAEIEIKSFASETGAVSDKAGGLADAMAWKGDLGTITDYTITGPINSDDMAFIKDKMTSLQTLDLSGAQAEGGIIPDNAFAGMPLVMFSSPNALQSVGKNIFSGCKELAAVVWNTTAKIPNDAFDKDVNPNLLVFVPAEDAAPNNSSARNIIVNNTADHIYLSDGADNNFYSPKQFYTKSITYTHDFKLTTGSASGWETICLPFDCSYFVHESKGELKPFAEYDGLSDKGSYKPFWLRELTDIGFKDVKQIEANKPYIISMPNNSNYATRYRVGGKVTFSASNVYVPQTVPGSAEKGDVTLYANFMNSSETSDMLLLNTEASDDHEAGSIFVLNSGRAVRPFEAYVISRARSRAYISVGSLSGETDDEATAIKERTIDDSDMVKVYNLSGVLVKQSTKEDALKGLAKGVYIVNGKRVMVK